MEKRQQPSKIIVLKNLPSIFIPRDFKIATMADLNKNEGPNSSGSGKGSSSSKTSSLKGKSKATVIDHTYYDWSRHHISELMGAEDSVDTEDSYGSGPSPKKKKYDSNRKTFPMILHEVLSNPAYRHIISWMPHGRSWKVHDKEKLTSVVCKEHFGHESFESFYRSVNGWGFKVSAALLDFIMIRSRSLARNCARCIACC